MTNTPMAAAADIRPYQSVEGGTGRATIQARVTTEDYDRIAQAATVASLSVSAWIRQTILEALDA